MRKWCLLIAFVLCAVVMPLPCNAQQTHVTKKDQAARDLNIALDYFQSGKFHEALLILARLDSTYRLNPRFRAYTGLCYYYDGDYSNATRLLDASIPSLKAFSPDERSLYYHADADSHFILEQYDAAEASYDSLLTICDDKQKAEAYYRLGFIKVYKERWLEALDDLQSALVYYRTYLPDEKARIAQIRNMIQGCCEEIKKTL